MLAPVEVLRGAAAMLEFSRATVAVECGLSHRTVRRAFEDNARASLRTLNAIRAGLERFGATFMASDPQSGPGVSFERGSRPADRAVAGARVALGVAQLPLARMSRRSPRTLMRLEDGNEVSDATMKNVIAALRQEGATLLRSPDGDLLGFRIRLDRLSRDDLRF